jgi:opacity protein-like surface antigen
MKLRWFLLCVFSFFPLASQGEIFADSSGISGNGYVGIHYSGLRYEEDTSFKAHQPGAIFRVGYEIGDYLGVEGQLGSGLHDDNINGVSIGVDYLASIYLRGSIFLWDPQARLYGLVGVTRGKVTAKAFGLSSSLTDTEMSYGIGVELYGNSRNAFSLEFMRYLDGEDNGVNYTVDAFNIGYIHRF